MEAGHQDPSYTDEPRPSAFISTPARLDCSSSFMGSPKSSFLRVSYWFSRLSLSRGLLFRIPLNIGLVGSSAACVRTASTHPLIGACVQTLDPRVVANVSSRYHAQNIPFAFLRLHLPLETQKHLLKFPHTTLDSPVVVAIKELSPPTLATGKGCCSHCHGKTQNHFFQYPRGKITTFTPHHAQERCLLAPTKTYISPSGFLLLLLPASHHVTLNAP
ncbi:hypothetical protein E2C01_068064 [Portunus trituberculatus]|uniref:Uncharacterized protein n=1 Tax=Portunus trituberculatus TaxID=210409 RepID=A0A5B7HWW7_PORTR|nr:hypothetical protein [Portunus trituberculatus]